MYQFNSLLHSYGYEVDTYLLTNSVQCDTKASQNIMQSQMEIKYYSVMYFECTVTKFDML